MANSPCDCCRTARSRGFFLFKKASTAIMAPNVPNVIPLPANPVAANCRLAVSPIRGSPSLVSTTWPDQRCTTCAWGIIRRSARSSPR